MSGPPSPRDLLAVTLGDAYELERQLGGGGMALVFLAHERALGRPVVIKLLSPDVAPELSVERFVREARLSASLQHPNIVPVLATGAVGIMPYYTMPFIAGDSLRECLDRQAPGTRLPIQQSLGILRDVARALSYAHERGVVHRDIKPGNVLLAHDAALVADFGIAKAVDAARTASATSTGVTLTRTGVVLGTPAYMAPEQAAGDPGVDFRADLYAWGMMAYELLSGAHPFADCASLQALLSAQLTRAPRPLADAAPDIPPAVADLVMQCLAKQATDRPKGARVLAQTIDMMATSGPTVMLPRGARSRRVLRRLVPAVLGVAAVAGAFVLLRARRTPMNAASEGAAVALTAPIAESASDLYLRGKVRVTSENRDDNDAAISALRRAVAVDPSFAPAHAALARAYLIKAFYFAPDSGKKSLNVDAEVEIAKALALDPRSGDAWMARGLMLWTPARRFPHEEAIQAYRRAIALDSTLDEAHHQLGVVYFHVGLFDRATAEFRRALAINPSNSLARMRLGVVAMYRSDYQHAYEIFSSSPSEKNPALWGFQMGSALFRLGRVGEAFAVIDSLLLRSPHDEGGVGTSVRAIMLAKAGRTAEAVEAIQRSTVLGRGFGHFHHTAYNLGVASAIMGRHTDAVRWLQSAAEDGFPCYPLFAADELLSPLRSDQSFSALLARLRRDYERRRSTL